MQRLQKRIEKLEERNPKRPLRFVWDDHVEPRDELERRIEEAKAEGFDVLVASWTKPDTLGRSLTSSLRKPVTSASLARLL